MVIDLLRGLGRDSRLTREEALALTTCDVPELMRAGARRRDEAHGAIVSY